MPPASLPLVTLHGFTGSPASWKRVTEPVAHKLGAVCHLALSGHSSDLPPEAVASFEAEASRIAGEIGSLTREPVVLAGYSLGARVALVTAVRHPRRVARLVLVGSQPGLRTEAERIERRAADARWVRLLESAGLEAFIEQWQALPLWTSQRALGQELLAAQRRERLQHDPVWLASSLQRLGLAEMPSCWPGLAELTMPVDLVVGALDQKFSRIAQEMAALMPEARVVSVADSGHNVLLERPRELAGILIEATTVRGRGRV